MRNLSSLSRYILSLCVLIALSIQTGQSKQDVAIKRNLIGTDSLGKEMSFYQGNRTNIHRAPEAAPDFTFYFNDANTQYRSGWDETYLYFIEIWDDTRSRRLETVNVSMSILNLLVTKTEIHDLTIMWL